MSVEVGSFRSGGKVVGEVSLKELRCEMLKSVREKKGGHDQESPCLMSETKSWQMAAVMMRRGAEFNFVNHRGADCSFSKKVEEQWSAGGDVDQGGHQHHL